MFRELQENMDKQFNNIRKTIQELNEKFYNDIEKTHKKIKQILELKNTE